MKRMILPVAFLALSTAFAADMPKPDLYLIHEEIIKPGSIMAYESAGKEFVAALNDKKVTSPALNWNAFATNDLHYFYLVQIPSYAALDGSQAEWEKAKTAMGADRWSALQRRNDDAMASYNDSVFMRRADLSYVPANPRLKPEEQRYFRLDYYYLVPGKQTESEAIARDYVALFKQKNIGEPYSIWIGMLGNDLPLLVASIPAKSAADLAAADERVNAALGADVLPLQARAMAITRRFERREGTARPDLSHMVTMAPK